MKPSLQNANLPEPIWRNTPVFFGIICESIFPIPRSHFGHFLPLLSWLDNSYGTPHLAVDPRLQSKPSFSRCNGQMVIAFVCWVYTAVGLRIRSTSSFGPENPRLAVWLEIGFEQASKGIICASFFLSLMWNPHIPPKIDLREQHTSLFTQWHASQLSLFTTFH